MLVHLDAGTRPSRMPVLLPDVAATLLGPLHARAADARRPLPLLGDALACELVARLDHDFTRFTERPTLRPVIRTLVFDDLVRRFLAANPSATIVEVGAGLNTRFERIDNGRQRWFDVDLPEVTALRRALLSSSARRTQVATSIMAPSWLDALSTVRAPVCFVFEAVLGYIPGEQLRIMLQGLVRRFPGATLLFDLHPRWRWVGETLVTSDCVGEAPAPLMGDFLRAIEGWRIGLHLRATTRFLGWTPLRSGPARLGPVRTRDGGPCVVAEFVAATHQDSCGPACSSG